MKLSFNVNNNIEMPELILGIKNYNKIGCLTNVDDFVYENHMVTANKISLSVYKELNGIKCNLWDEIKDRRLIWVKEFNEWFQITVSVEEKNSVIKKIIGTSLCEVELGQILLYDTEINTENDIARDDYTEPTIFYNSKNHAASLLHRLIKSAPHYSIKYVAPTLINIQRTFSFNGTSIYDALTGEIAEEIGCLFLFDSTDRSISVYDLYKTCENCEYRGEYDDICPDCGSSEYIDSYGLDTTILIDSENLANSLTVEGLSDEVKNCFRLVAGDDYMTNTIININPNGSPYIYNFSKDLEDMSETLVKKLESYNKLYNDNKPTYIQLTEEMYDLTDQLLELRSAMMPSIETSKSNASKELAKLTTSNLSPVAVSDVSVVSKSTADSAVLAMAKCVANSSNYKITITTSSLSSQTWKGKFRVENYSNDEDYAESTSFITVQINDDYETYIRQKIQKTIDRDDTQLVDMLDITVSIEEFKASLKLYCLARLENFKAAYESTLDVLIDMKCGNDDIYPEIYNDLYIPYKTRLTAIETEIKVRDAEITNVETELNGINKQRTVIQKLLNIENYMGEDLWKELCSFKRDDTYENSNYISDGMNNSEVIEKAQEFLSMAQKELVTASTLQLSISSDLNNLLAIPEFKPLTDYFEIGNWIRVRVDENLYRLRLIGFTIDFSDLQNISVEFSDVTQTSNGANDVASIIDKVSSMTTSFNIVAHQAEQGSKGYTEIDKIRKDGLNAALYTIQSNNTEDFIINNNGILGRSYDDITEDYAKEQIKINHNLICFTDDNWLSVKQALGYITYTNPLTNENVNKYGVICDTVIAGTLIGNDIIGGNIYSSNYSSAKGTYINLNNGSFTFAGGKLKYDSSSNIINVTGKITFEDIGYSNDSVKSSVKNSLGVTAVENSIVSISQNMTDANSTIAKLKKCLGFTTEISSDYVISPYIGGGYLQIENASYGSVIIDPSNIKKSGYILGVYNSSKSLVMGVDTNGNGIFKGNITATGGIIGNWIIGTPTGYGLNECLYTLTNFGIIGLQSSSSSSNVAFFVKNSNNEDITYIKNDGTLYTQKANILKGTIGGWTISNNALSSSASTYIYPSLDEQELIRSYILNESSLTDSQFQASDFDGDNAVTVKDSLAVQKLMLGMDNIDNFPNYSKPLSTIYTKIDPNDANESICIYGTNAWGRTVKTSLGINGIYTDNIKTYKIIMNNTNTAQFIGKYCNIYLPNDSTYWCVIRGSNIEDTQVFKVKGDGNVYAEGTITQGSDERFKDNISDMPNQYLQLLKRLRPRTYKFKNDKSHFNNGLIAQEVKEAMISLGLEPETLVRYGRNDFYSLDYNGFIPILIKGYQHLQEELEKLKNGDN